MDIKKFKVNIYLYLVIFLLYSFNTLHSQPVSSQLYFCEKYIDGIEFGVNSTFTTGWIIVMLDFRPVNKTIGVNKVFIEITKVADKNGYYPDEISIERIPFEVSADWDYLYFEDHEKIAFKEPGIYRVYCLKEDGHEISSAFLKVIAP